MENKKKIFYIHNKAVIDIYYKKDEGEELSIFENVEKEYKKLEAFFDFEQTRKVTIKLVYSRKEMNEHWGQKSTISAMVDNKNPYLIYIFSPLVFEKLTKQKTELMIPIITHEIAHTFVTKINKRCFSWMNEGLCEFLSEGALKKASIKQMNWNWLKEHEVLLDPSISWCEVMKHEGYTTAHALVSYIISTHGKDSMFELLKIRRVKNTNMDPLFSKALNKDFGEVLVDFEKKIIVQ